MIGITDEKPIAQLKIINLNLPRIALSSLAPSLRHPEGVHAIASLDRVRSRHRGRCGRRCACFIRGRNPQTFAGAMQLTRALQASGEKAKASEVVRSAWTDLDGGEDEEKQLVTRFGALLKSQDHVARLDRLLWEGKQDAAKRMMGRVDAGYRALAEARMALRNEKKNADKLVAKVPKKLQRDAGLVYERA